MHKEIQNLTCKKITLNPFLIVFALLLYVQTDLKPVSGS